MARLTVNFEKGAKALHWLSQKDNGKELSSTLRIILDEQSDQKDVQSTIDVELRGQAQKLCRERGLSEEFSNALADSIATYVNEIRVFIGTSPVFPGTPGQFLQ